MNISAVEYIHHTSTSMMYSHNMAQAYNKVYAITIAKKYKTRRYVNGQHGYQCVSRRGLVNILAWKAS